MKLNKLLTLGLVFIFLIGIVSVNAKITKQGGAFVGSSTGPNGEKIITFKETGEYFIEDEFGSKYFDNIKAGGRLYFKNNELIKANFVTTKEGYYQFGNYDVLIPKDSEVQFKDNQLFIRVPEGYKIETPEKFSEKEGGDIEIGYFFKNRESGELVFEFNGEEHKISKIQGTGKEYSGIVYDTKNKAFYADSPLTLDKGIDIGNKKGGMFKETFSKTRTSVPDKMYLFFDGEKHQVPGSYVSLSEDKVVIDVEKGKSYESPSVEFWSGTNYAGLEIEKDDYLMIQSLGGEIVIENRDDEKLISKIITKGNYGILSGIWQIDYNRGSKTPRATPKKNLAGSTSVPIHIRSLDEKGENVLKYNGKPYDIFITNHNDMSTGYSEDLDSGKIAVYKTGTIGSVRNNFHSLSLQDQIKFKATSPEQRRVWAGLSPDELKQKLADVKTSDKPPAPGNIGRGGDNPVKKAILSKFERGKTVKDVSGKEFVAIAGGLYVNKNGEVYKKGSCSSCPFESTGDKKW